MIQFTKTVSGSARIRSAREPVKAEYKEFTCQCCGKTEHMLTINDLVVSGGYHASLDSVNEWMYRCQACGLAYSETLLAWRS